VLVVYCHAERGLTMPHLRTVTRPGVRTATARPDGWGWGILGIVALTLAVYAPVWQYAFVSWDDPTYVTENVVVTAGLTWRGVWWALTTTHDPYWHPITWLSHMTDVQVFGLNAGGHHVTNLILHLANTVLLFGVLRRMTLAAGRSAFVAALFAVHPLHVESVAWVAERKDLLSTWFLLLALWAYTGYVQRPGVRRYLLVCVVFALGLMAKPMIVTFPFLLLLLDIWPLGRLPMTAAGRLSAVWRLVREKLPLFALAVAAGVAALVVQLQVGAVGTLGALSVQARVDTALVAFAAYVWKTVWPVRLAVFYPYAAPPPALLVVAIGVALGGASVAAVRLLRRAPYVAVGWFWYLGLLVPVIGIVQVGDQAMADRFTYLPIVGLSVIAAWGAHAVWNAKPRPGLALAAAASLVVAGAAIAAHAQVATWRNSETLWRHALEVTGANHRAHAGLGDALVGQGRLTEAIDQYAEAVRLVPTSPEWRDRLALALNQTGRLEDAAVQYGALVRIEPDRADAHNNLWAVLARLGRVDDAIAAYHQALRLRPTYALARRNLALAFATEGLIEDALREGVEAMRLEPGHAAWHDEVALMYARSNRMADAIAEFRLAFRLDPHDQTARRALESQNLLEK
jgi:protein O-mannosyl-transferase